MYREYSSNLLLILCFLFSYQYGLSDDNGLNTKHIDNNKEQFQKYLENAIRTQRINPDSAHYYANMAIDFGRNRENDTMIAKAQNVDAAIYTSTGQNEKALFLFKKSGEVFSKYNLEISTAKVYNNIGIVFTYLDIYDSALVYIFKALDIYENLDDTAGMLYPIMSIAACFTKMKEYKKSLAYNQKAYKLAIDVGNIYMSNEILNNIGLNYRSLNNPDSAFYCFNSYLEYQLLNPNPYTLGIAYNNLGLVFFDQNNNQKAIENYRKSMENFNVMHHSWGIANAFQNMSDIYLKDNINDSAIYYSKLAEKETLDLDLPELKKDINYNLYKAYRNKGNSDESLKYFTIFSKLKDTIFDIEKIKVTQKLETKYETAKKESENIRLKSEIEINKFRSQRRDVIEFFVLFVFVTVIVVILLMRKNLKQKHKLALHDSDMLKQKLEFSKQELASKALHLACQNEFRAKLLETTNEIYDNLDDEGKVAIKSLLSDLENNIDSGAWNEFETRFEQVHESFFLQLNTHFPDLTQNDRRICAFLKLNMSTKDIALLIHRSPRSVESSRYRLRKKFDLDKDIDIVDFLQKIG